MRIFAVLTGCVLGLLLLGNPSARGAAADSLYLNAYRQITEADQYLSGGRAEAARGLYEQALENLQRLQNSVPTYSPRAVEFRIEYIKQKLASLPAPARAAEPAPERPAPPAATLEGLRQQVERLQAENQALEAKLREAMAPRPAAVDPQEFARAESRIRELEKQKELLLADVQKTQARQPQALDHAHLEQLKGELEAANRKLVASVAEIATLTRQNQDLSAQAGQLRQQLEARPAVDVAALQNELAQTRETARAEAASAEAARRSLAELEATLADRGGEAPRGRVKELENERDNLMKKLNEANRELYDVKARGQLAQFQNLTNQLANLRARLEVFEARKVPYTREELALMDRGVPRLAPAANPRAARRSVRELPPGASGLVAEAEAAFARRRFAEAEEKYRQVLEMDRNNPVTLANLAAIQLEQEKVSEAERNLSRALELNQDDSYALSLLGMVRFRQEKFEEALDLLSRAAQIEPNNAETQNYLGITLSQQGQRDAAEAALRKAIQLAPNYAGAHHNLAVVYATQKPPFMQLAKYHYSKAIELGQPSNPELEKQLNL